MPPKPPIPHLGSKLSGGSQRGCQSGSSLCTCKQSRIVTKTRGEGHVCHA